MTSPQLSGPTTSTATTHEAQSTFDNAARRYSMQGLVPAFAAQSQLLHNVIIGIHSPVTAGEMSATPGQQQAAHGQQQSHMAPPAFMASPMQPSLLMHSQWRLCLNAQCPMPNAAGKASKIPDHDLFNGTISSLAASDRVNSMQVFWDFNMPYSIDDLMLRNLKILALNQPNQMQPGQ